jgi:hypothetical protein
MEELSHGEFVVELTLIALLLVLGPLAYFFGVDSRTGDARGGWPGTARH